MILTKIKNIHQVDFISSNDLLFDFKTETPAQIDRGVLVFNDGGVKLEQYILDDLDLWLIIPEKTVH